MIEFLNKTYKLKLKDEDQEKINELLKIYSEDKIKIAFQNMFDSEKKYNPKIINDSIHFEKYLNITEMPIWTDKLSPKELNALKASYFRIVWDCLGYTTKINPEILKLIYSYRVKNVPYPILEAYFKEHHDFGVKYCSEKKLIDELYKKDEVIKDCWAILKRLRNFYHENKHKIANGSIVDILG